VCRFRYEGVYLFISDCHIIYLLLFPFISSELQTDSPPAISALAINHLTPTSQPNVRCLLELNIVNDLSCWSEEVSVKNRRQA
jgi:hypothetical protein